VHRKNISIYIQQDATLHSLLYLKTALHVSSGTSTHHQERIQLYLQHLVFVTPLLLPAAIVKELELQSSSKRQVAVTVWQIPDAVDTVVCASDDGWRYHSKHVEQFPDIINCVTLHVVGYIWNITETKHGDTRSKNWNHSLSWRAFDTLQYAICTRHFQKILYVID
jgi:hypothetical protein